MSDLSEISAFVPGVSQCGRCRETLVRAEYDTAVGRLLFFSITSFNGMAAKTTLCTVGHIGAHIMPLDVPASLDRHEVERWLAT